MEYYQLGRAKDAPRFKVTQEKLPKGQYLAKGMLWGKEIIVRGKTSDDVKKAWVLAAKTHAKRRACYRSRPASPAASVSRRRKTRVVAFNLPSSARLH
jgi:hypothetical protein